MFISLILIDDFYAIYVCHSYLSGEIDSPGCGSHLSELINIMLKQWQIRQSNWDFLCILDFKYFKGCYILSTILKRVLHSLHVIGSGSTPSCCI